MREPVEYEIARIETAKLLPLSRFREWIDVLDADAETIVMCHHGVRSAQVCRYLMQNDFEKVETTLFDKIDYAINLRLFATFYFCGANDLIGRSLCGLQVSTRLRNLFQYVLRFRFAAAISRENESR